MNITQSAGQYTIKNHNPFSLQRLESVPNRCALITKQIHNKSLVLPTMFWTSNAVAEDAMTA